MKVHREQGVGAGRGYVPSLEHPLEALPLPSAFGKFHFTTCQIAGLSVVPVSVRIESKAQSWPGKGCGSGLRLHTAFQTPACISELSPTPGPLLTLSPVFGT